jgi:prefoldin beta subunit
VLYPLHWLPHANILSTRLEDTIKETQEKLEKKKTEIIQIQTAAQSQAKEAPQ